LPSPSNSITGGAATQHFGAGGESAAPLLLVDQRFRTVDQPQRVARIDCDSGDLTRVQLFGRGLGHAASTA